ncbi:MAG: hypothetical protein RML15_08785 [Bacteroidota bacterium]|nr:hypothetical protein [Candidatus Kapabacteria bacterium]MCS7302736.1 hypothetical protein [Candidatus Kapabacteria bacterium]MDW8272486.1 hypothetical protein [Bacteroidota bacterium]
MNNYSELIYLYLDGEATPEEQQALFAALSQDEQLQQEFFEAVQLYRAIEVERVVTTAPPEIKAAVFSAVGISPVSPISSLLRRVAQIASATAAVVAGTVGMYVWLNQKETAPLPAPPSLHPAPSYLAEPTTSSPSIQQLRKNDVARSLAVPGGTVLPSSQEESPSSTWMEEKPPLNDEEFTLERHPLLSSASPLVRLVSGRIGMVHVPIHSATAIDAPRISTQFAYRGSLLAASGPAASPQNFSITALYRFDENHRIGLEFRRAPYTLNIAQPSGTFSTVLLSSVAVAYSFTEPDVRILGGMPFVQPTVGISSMGPLATLSAGLTFPVTSAFSFSAGLDGSALVYSSQVASTLSVTLGVNIGLPLR